jgi:hypothetical protein
MLFGSIRTFSDCLYILNDTVDSGEKKMKKVIITLGIIGTTAVILAAYFSGCINTESEVNYETFTIYRGFQEPSENITVYNVSFPLDESEAVEVFEKIMGRKPRCWMEVELLECPITKTDTGWVIQDGPLLLADIFFIINEQNSTV